MCVLTLPIVHYIPIISQLLKKFHVIIVVTVTEQKIVRLLVISATGAIQISRTTTINRERKTLLLPKMTVSARAI